jgi:hypothetical protein
MGRRRNVGESRSAGAGRPCSHRNALVSIERLKGPPVVRCGRCGAELTAAEIAAAGRLPRRPRDRRRRP